MKNIHLIPTDKPSRLWINTITGELVLDEEPNTLHSQNIYITSDEEIKEGDWYFDGTDLVHKKTKYNDALVDGNKDAKKIILTTDQNLIKSGVQAIDDEFLEWFVQNPSCERVEVKTNRIVLDDVNYNFDIVDYKFKIIIPKEEVLLQSSIDGEAIWGENQNQHFIDMMKAKEKLGLYEEPETDYSFFIKQKEEEFKNFLKKRETTPEELAEYLGFVKGVKWQQEQDENKYSEEEVLSILNKMFEWYIDDTPYHFNLTMLKNKFEQFKKK